MSPCAANQSTVKVVFVVPCKMSLGPEREKVVGPVQSPPVEVLPTHLLRNETSFIHQDVICLDSRVQGADFKIGHVSIEVLLEG